MRTFFLLVLTFAAVTKTRQSKSGNIDKILLGDAIISLKKILNRDLHNLNQFVKNINEGGNGCSANTLCQTAKVLNNTHLRDSLLERQLHAYAVYTGHSNCSVSGSEEITLRKLLQHTKACCQKLLAGKEENV